MKNIWILNHYATDQFCDHGGRHYNFAKYLLRAGYRVTIFCASTVHNSDKNLIGGTELFAEAESDEINYVLIRARNYRGNGAKRVLNMLDYYRNVQKVAPVYAQKHGGPDVIIGSSVHPLACVAAIHLAKKFRCKKIVEIRDLWPESIVAYGIATKANPMVMALYSLEKWIYKKADAIIFTAEGGCQYIMERGWDTEQGGPIDLIKVFYINNGVDLEVFDNHREHSTFEDSDLDDPDTFKVLYTGSIRLANQVGDLVDVAAELKGRGEDRIKILLYGAGGDVEKIQARIQELQLDNIIFKGSVDKKYIPYVLSKSDLNIYLLKISPLYRYGLSLNKSFEYFASGVPTLANANSGYSIIDQYECGVCMEEYTPQKMAEEIIRLKGLPSSEYARYCSNARIAAQAYDFRVLTKRLIQVIEG